MFPELTDTEIQALKEKHPSKRMRQICACGATFVVRPPSEPEIVRMTTAAADKERRLTAANRLLRDCCLWPAEAELNEILRELPALPVPIADEILEMAGMTQRIEKKDL